MAARKSSRLSRSRRRPALRTAGGSASAAARRTWRIASFSVAQPSTMPPGLAALGTRRPWSSSTYGIRRWPHTRPARERGDRLAGGTAASGLRLPAELGLIRGTHSAARKRIHAVPARSSAVSRSAPPSKTARPAESRPRRLHPAADPDRLRAQHRRAPITTTSASARIKGDGAGQTIGIYEEGYNPAFVDTSSPNYSTSALAVFDKTFGLPDPPSLTFVDHTGTPLSSTNNSSNNPDFVDYGAGVEIALDIEWAHAMAPGASIVVLCAIPDRNNYYEDIPLGIATLAGLPGVSVVSASYGWYPG